MSSNRATHRCGVVSASLTGVVLDFIGREYAPKPHASKLLAQAARTSHRTAERWLAGKAVPSGENFLNLLAECEDLAAEVQQLIEQRRAKRGG